MSQLLGDTLPLTGHILPQALHNVLHVVSVDVVSFQQAAVAGALHSELQKTDKKRKMRVFFCVESHK